jgi:hypothetical protein
MDGEINSSGDAEVQRVTAMSEIRSLAGDRKTLYLGSPGHFSRNAPNHELIRGSININPAP